jgi:hypothetical protein
MFREQLILGGGVQFDLAFQSRTDYRLACRKDGRVLVEYRSGDGYEFKSVEKLRYDFERDAEDALRQG